MKTINKILVPVDFSDCAKNAFRYAINFADKYDAEIIVQHIVSQDVALDYPGFVVQETSRQVKDARTNLERLVEEVMLQTNLNKALKNIPNIQSELSVGAPLALIVEKAKHSDVDLIIMGTNGTHDGLDKLLGSTASYVIKNAACPILVVPENAEATTISNIGYATNLQETDAFYIYDLGKFLSPFNAVFNVCHIHLKDEPVHYVDLEDLRDFFKGKEGSKINFYENTADSIAAGLHEFAEVFGIDLMVLPSPKRNFFGNLFHKSTTRKMAFESQIPILVLR